MSEESPNKDIDKAIKKILKELDTDKEKVPPLDMVCKVLNTAIAWEKVKHAINDKDDSFNADDL